MISYKHTQHTYTLCYHDHDHTYLRMYIMWQVSSTHANVKIHTVVNSNEWKNFHFYFFSFFFFHASIHYFKISYENICIYGKWWRKKAVQIQFISIIVLNKKFNHSFSYIYHTKYISVLMILLNQLWSVKNREKKNYF